MRPKEMLVRFDGFLAEHGIRFEAVVIGGAALALLGVISRETQDRDVLDPAIPDEVAQAAREFSRRLRAAGEDLREDGLNNGPETLKKVLPPGWLLRLDNLFTGRALNLHTLGRPDLLKSKVFAYCDRGQDLKDCLSLKPTEQELGEALPWLVLQDVHPDWPVHVERSIAELRRRLGHGL